MSTFEKYTVVLYETADEHHQIYPRERFVAFLKEIPEASLHEYGRTQGLALKKLRAAFTFFQAECKKNNITPPEPKQVDVEEYSGKIVLRMPKWLHGDLVKLADEDGVSLNSYIIQQLIRSTTFQSVKHWFTEWQTKFIDSLNFQVLSIRKEKFFAVSELQYMPPTNLIDFKKVG